MSYIMFHRAERNEAIRSYVTLKGAKIGVKSANRNAGYEAYACMHEDDFYQRKTVVENLMTGIDVEIPLRNAGTCVDPSTERYWSM